MDIGNKIKKYRESQNMSQEELAIKVFVTRQTISNWETNKNYPDIKSLSLLSNIFGVTLDDFIKTDLEEIKKRIDEESLKKFNLLGTIYNIELIILVISAYPLFKFLNILGIIIWIVFAIISLVTAIKIEKFKHKNNIETYKEIIAFCEGRTLTYEESQQELGKRNYQKILLAISSALIALIIFILTAFIIGILI